jgi:signal transduction histidine kinase
MTLVQRLTIWQAILVTCIIISLGAAVFGMMRWALVNDIDKMLDDTAAFINMNSRFVPLQSYDRSMPYSVDLPPLDVFRASGVEVQVWLAGDDGFRPIDASANLRDYLLPLDEEALGIDHTLFHNVMIDGQEWRVRTSPIYYGGRLVGSVQVAGSLQTVHQGMRGLLVIIIVSSGLAILGSALLSMWLSRRMLQPIQDITQAAQYIAGAKDLATRLEYTGPKDEIGKLNEVFNQMMARLEHLFTVQQRFVADISHELRTPLTSIRGNIEMIKRYGADDASIDAIHEEVDRMSRLVNDLLMLARADYGGLTVDLYPLDLDSFLMDFFRSAKRQGQAHNVDVKLTQLEPLRVNGSADRLNQVLYNLVNNAFKFTPAGGMVLLSLTREGDQAVITVSDNGCGIKQEDLTRIFDRFYQADSSRVHPEGAGFGLGLSIAKWIVEAHGGTIRAESVEGQGATFIISIPLHGIHPDSEHAEGQSRSTKTRVAISRRKSAEQYQQLTASAPQSPPPNPPKTPTPSS